MYNIDPDNNFYRNLPNNSKYYSDQQLVCNVKSESDKNFPNIKEFLDDLKLSFDIVTISKTCVESSTTDDFLLNGYEVFHVVRSQKKRKGWHYMLIRY